MEILIIKAPSGEEFIGKFDEMAEGFVGTKVFNIWAQPDPETGQLKLGFTPAMPYADNFLILKGGGMILATPKEQLENQYKEIIGDIILPSNKIVLS